MRLAQWLAKAQPGGSRCPCSHWAFPEVMGVSIQPSPYLAEDKRTGLGRLNQAYAGQQALGI